MTIGEQSERIRTWLLSLGLVLACGTAVASDKVDFSRYDVILDRKPFGEPPAAETPATPPPATAATSFIKDIRMCAITDNPDFGVRVGFVNLAAKKNYYMRVGETEDEIQVVDADYEKEAALLQKGADAFWINMAGQVNPGSSGPFSTATAAPADGAVASAGVASSPGPAMAPPSPAPERMSYAERVKIRREALEQRRKEQEERLKKLAGGEAEKKLKEYQMELIREGGKKGPPLPIPLTKEMDDQLVAEGVLPPLGESGAPADAAPTEGAPAEAVPAEGTAAGDPGAAAPPEE